jgi:hypothetical protein
MIEFTDLSDLYGTSRIVPQITVEEPPPKPEIKVVECPACPAPPACPACPPSTPPLTRTIVELLAFAILGTFLILGMDIISNMRR